MNSLLVETVISSTDYELIDSGEGEKLERFGDFTLSRPDPQALWHKRLDEKIWKKTDGHFGRLGSEKGEWSVNPKLPKKWEVSLGGIKLYVKPTSFKHVGIFPEQVSNWKWLENVILKNESNDGIEVLNLFGYTGGASLICAKAGAKVVHVDGSKTALTWARENSELSGLDKKPIRWILEDARSFIKKEIKRGRKYDGIIMDPPSFGHGPENEIWKIEEHFLLLIDDCLKILKDKPVFFLINGYSSGYSAIAYMNNLLSIQERNGGKIEMGELTIKESESKGSNFPARLLSCGIFARWSR